MKTTTVQTVTQLAFLPRVFPINCYLVEEQEGLTLIDAGMPFCKNGILKAASRLRKPIRRIVLTHAHQDHVGALDGLKNALPEAQVYISARDARLLAGDVSLMSHEPNLPVRGGVPKGIKTKPDVLLQDGDMIGSLQAVAAAGHTPGSMAFLDVRNRILIAGDAIQVRGGLAVSGKLMPLFPFPAMATWSKREALASAQKLRRLEPSLLAVGHGRMLAQPGSDLDRVIAEAEADPAFSRLQTGGK
ncbi:MAG: fold metallo-hydrolase [Paenibacillaceae bacterium]|jgi:glyoxylase-like metal-dependent hydrolase (beta-lactamase superfamily II)|nr:fold metallo-hydrolase [Paenibacillaceae bacterium]